ncbi:hypothetical protein TWF569_000580 [Orbilia oligospora]|uniref:Cytochrome c oxidase assembly factor 5 n=1 Tax=Orbilia oligospora TaxID=2813651 RepID=A0A7C8J438_ORBOL|nr:hypothetical protein TWF102_010265 [Orbilia oligospora]KAF3089700.1 hypothetical protein TWF706_010312 [Orbilia oligospora]KAF3108791.1 hypothetical protein TWF103_005388 [Orbilia oligospora]KAF3126310.1 hypothetical protein TWF569_000580 [Orbilia oligospora]KAF3150970.1 hypothetical protein TWF594_008189 [Orbilia oligospora]
MPSSCKELYNAVVECLRESDCIKNGYSPAECIRMPLKEKLPAQCQNLLHAYGECKRRNIDMRYRFRVCFLLSLLRTLLCVYRGGGYHADWL